MTERDETSRVEDDQVAPGEAYAEEAGIDPSPQEVTRYEELLADGEGDQLQPATGAQGVPAADLADKDLLRELGSVHRTRDDTLRHGSDEALETHTTRSSELEAEYLRRFPGREIDPNRLRDADD